MSTSAPVVSGGPFRLTRPSVQELDALLTAQREAPFTYPDVGATRGPTPSGYTVDRNRIRLGTGEQAWERAVDHYLTHHSAFCDFQDQSPRPIRELETAGVA